jgi:hypothetical protein
MWAMGRCGKRARMKNEEVAVGKKKKRKMEETKEMKDLLFSFGREVKVPA